MKGWRSYRHDRLRAFPRGNGNAHSGWYCRMQQSSSIVTGLMSPCSLNTSADETVKAAETFKSGMDSTELKER